MKGAIGTLIVFYSLQGCLANIIFTALNIENHPCRPENLKVCTLADSGFFKNLLHQGGVKSTVFFLIFENLEIKIQKTTTKIGVFLTLPSWLSQFS